MTTGRVLAASTRYASQTSPGRGFIEQVEDFLFRRARADLFREHLAGRLLGISFLTLAEWKRRRRVRSLSRVGYRKSGMSTEKKARLHEIVSLDPDRMHGAPCFRGTRVPVRLLLDDLKSGFTIDEFLSACPTVSRELVEGYLELAQDLITECVVS